MTYSQPLISLQEVAERAGLSSAGVAYWAKKRGHKKINGRWQWREYDAENFVCWLRLSTMGKARRS